MKRHDELTKSLAVIKIVRDPKENPKWKNYVKMINIVGDLLTA